MPSITGTRSKSVHEKDLPSIIQQDTIMLTRMTCHYAAQLETKIEPSRQDLNDKSRIFLSPPSGLHE